MNPHANSANMARVMARVRSELAPKPDHPRYVLETCETCGDPFPRLKGRRRHWCPDCSAARMVRSADASSSHSGEAYERVVRGQLAHWHAEATRLGLVPVDPRPVGGDA